MNKSSKIYIAGHKGMVGSAILRNLESKGYTNFVYRTIDELDLTNQAAVDAFLKEEKPAYVFLAAAKVGGIVANNTYRAQFIYENLMIQNNIIHASYKYGVEKLLFLGSSCIYPKNAPQPLKEEYLLTGVLEETNEPYAIAKIAGIKMCENYYRQYRCNFISVMPTNLYGPNDNYDLEKSHVLPALIRKFHLGHCLETHNFEAIKQDLNKRPIEGVTGGHTEEEILEILSKYGISSLRLSSGTDTINEEINNETQNGDDMQSLPLSPSLPLLVPQSLSLSVSPSPHRSFSPSLSPVSITLWGTGEVYREFLHVDDMADACVYLMENVDAPKLYKELQQTHINIGKGIDLTIKKLAEQVNSIVGFEGEIKWDITKPEGTFKKQQDVKLLNTLNWNSSIALKDGINLVYKEYIK